MSGIVSFLTRLRYSPVKEIVPGGTKANTRPPNLLGPSSKLYSSFLQ